MEFRPGWKWRAINAMAGVVFGAFGTVIAVATTLDDAPLIVSILGAMCMVAGICGAARVLLMRVRVENDRLRTVGFVWSRTVSRDRIVNIASDPQSAAVTWRSSTGRVVVTPLSSLRTGDGFFPTLARKRRRVFLRRLSAWVRSGQVHEIPPSVHAPGERRARRAANPHMKRRADLVWDAYAWALPIVVIMLPWAAIGIGKRSSSTLTPEESATFVAVIAAISLVVVAAAVVRCLQGHVPSKTPRRSPLILVGGCFVALVILWMRADWELGEPLQWATCALAALAVATALTWILSSKNASGQDDR